MNLSKQLTLREKILLCILALLILGATYFFAVHQPVVTGLEELAIAQQEAEDANLILQAKEQKLNQMRAELEEILAQPFAAQTQQYDNLQKIMIFLNTTLSATQEYNLSFQPLTMPEDSNVVRRVIDMNFSCSSYEQARALLETLRTCEYRCQLGNASISPSTSDQVADVNSLANLLKGPVQVQVTVTFYEALQ